MHHAGLGRLGREPCVGRVWNAGFEGAHCQVFGGASRCSPPGHQPLKTNILSEVGKKLSLVEMSLLVLSKISLK